MHKKLINKMNNLKA